VRALQAKGTRRIILIHEDIGQAIHSSSSYSKQGLGAGAAGNRGDKIAEGSIRAGFTGFLDKMLRSIEGASTTKSIDGTTMESDRSTTIGCHRDKQLKHIAFGLGKRRST